MLGVDRDPSRGHGRDRERPASHPVIAAAGDELPEVKVRENHRLENRAQPEREERGLEQPSASLRQRKRCGEQPKRLSGDRKDQRRTLGTCRSGAHTPHKAEPDQQRKHEQRGLPPTSSRAGSLGSEHGRALDARQRGGRAHVNANALGVAYRTGREQDHQHDPSGGVQRQKDHRQSPRRRSSSANDTTHARAVGSARGA